MKNTTITITAYFPPISYFYLINQSENICIELYENYQRQSIRNRCYILSANGVQWLSIPIIKTTNKQIKDILIDNTVPWKSKHIHAIRSAYGKSPFFEYYSEELFNILEKKQKFLIDLNNEILQTCINLIDLSANISFTEVYSKEYSTDYRDIFSIKKYPPFIENLIFEPYNQCFSDRFSFVADLSILDLLFNVGFESKYYLNNKMSLKLISSELT
ncbi:MAG: WbqC family protein [Bacteroidales bacterium]|nr:WbqC family protein [Bacteroidales bacterium]